MGLAYLGMPDGMPGLHQVHSPGVSRMGFPIRLKSNKVEIGQERMLNKALREGCCERKKAWASVSSRVKMNTNRNLVRVITKSKSETQTVSNGCVSRGGREGGFKECPNIRDLVE